MDKLRFYRSETIIIYCNLIFLLLCPKSYRFKDINSIGEITKNEEPRILWEKEIFYCLEIDGLLYSLSYYISWFKVRIHNAQIRSQRETNPRYFAKRTLVRLLIWLQQEAQLSGSILQREELNIIIQRHFLMTVYIMRMILIMEIVA